ncbi:MAG: CAP domain-containing protein [Chloroflexi bacterium]|nr:CAP domain-containing protein [Chloroflexota bacterium]
MHRRRYALFITYIIIMALFTTAASAQQSTVVATQADGAGLLPEFNRWRTAIGIRPYAEDTRLTQAAQFHSDDQVARNYFSHDAPRPAMCNGKGVSDLGQRAACFGTFVSGEGIAKGQQTADEATRGWLHSPGHCLGVMDSTATHMGGGHAGDIWTFMYNGVNVPAPNPDFRAFCTCTSSSDGSEDAIQACVVKFNNGVTPVAPPPSSLQLSYQLPNATGSYNRGSSGGMGLGVKAEGTYTITVVPVTGNPTGISLTMEESVGRNSVAIPGATGTDKLVYTITKPQDLWVWFDSSKLPAGDTFRFNVLWESSYVAPTASVAAAPTDVPAGEPTAVPADTTGEVPAESTCTPNVATEALDLNIINNTDQPLTLGWYSFDCAETSYGTVEPNSTLTQGSFVGHVWVLRAPDGSVVRQFTAAAGQTDIVIDPVNPADVVVPADTTGTTAAADECNVTIMSADELVSAINKANDEAACPGANTLFVASDITVAAGYEGGENAFPVITTDITISSMNRIISRDASAPAFRFFYVDGTAGKAGALTLTDIQLTGGEALDAGAIMVDARDGGKSALHVRNGAFINNKSSGNGGAIMTLSMNGGQVDLVVEDSTFDGNAGIYGGAIYSGGFDGGNATATISGTNFTNNSAQEGGTLYNNGLGANGHAQMTLTDVTLSSSTSPRNDAIHNNGRAGGNAALTLTGNLLGGTGLSLGAPGIIFNQGTEGSAVTTWKDQTAGSAENVCIGVSETGTDLSVVPCP